jgi:type II secretory pathway pseudopilin PulG
MDLAGQANIPSGRRAGANAGYAMAALIVAMGVMAVMMTVAMPVWKHTTQREKEEELVFRGMQYVHAIGLYQRKFANAYPPNVDLLVEQKFLRKKFKDPITKDDFVVLPPGQALPGAPAAGAAQRGGAQPSAGRGGPSTSTAPGNQQTTAPQPTAAQPTSRGGLAPIGSQPGGIGGGTSAGVAGVTSKSKDQSIRLYNGRNHYNEWAFVYTPQLQAGQGSTTPPGVLGGGQRGQRGQQPGVGPGGRGQPPGTDDPFGRGRGTDRGRGPSPFGPNNPGGGRGFGPGQQAQPIFPPRGR